MKKKLEPWEREVKEAVEDQGLVFLTSDAMKKVYLQIYNAAQTNAHVLVLGETGAGKDQIAGTIYHLAPKKTKEERPFVSANCATWSTSDLAWPRSELFGQTHNRTNRWQPGLFHKADPGFAFLDKSGEWKKPTQATLLRLSKTREKADPGFAFLDEIGELKEPTQAMLLRLLETGEVEPHNGFPPKMQPEVQKELSKVDVRVIAATNRDVRDPAVLRQDLYYRLSGFVITVPPLQGRPEDIKTLAEAFALNWFCDDENARKVSELIKQTKGDALDGLNALKALHDLKAALDIRGALKAVKISETQENKLGKEEALNKEVRTAVQNCETALNDFLKQRDAFLKAAPNKKVRDALKAEPNNIKEALNALKEALNKEGVPQALIAVLEESSDKKALNVYNEAENKDEVCNALEAVSNAEKARDAFLENVNDCASKIRDKSLFFTLWDRHSNEKSVRYWLESAQWPGSVRELKHTIERALSSAKQLPLGPNDFPTLKAQQHYDAGNQALRRNQSEEACKQYQDARDQAKNAGGALQNILVDASSARADAHLKRAEVRLPTPAHVPSNWTDVADVWKAYTDALADLEQIPSHLRNNDHLKRQAEVFIKRAELVRRYPRLLSIADTPDSEGGKNGGKKESPPTDYPVEYYSDAIEAYTLVLEGHETPSRSGRRVRKLTPAAKAEAYCLRGQAYLRRGAARRVPRLWYHEPDLTLTKEQRQEFYVLTLKERPPQEFYELAFEHPPIHEVDLASQHVRARVCDWAVRTMVDQILTASASFWRLPHTSPIRHQDFCFSRNVACYAIKVAETWKREGEAHEKLCDLQSRFAKIGEALERSERESLESRENDLYLPDDKNSAYGLTVPYEAAGLADIADALRDFEEGLLLDSENADVHFHKGVALLASSHLGVETSRLEAIRCFKKTLNLDSVYGAADEEFWVTLALAALAQQLLTCDGDWESLLSRPVTSRYPDAWQNSFFNFVRCGAVSKRQPDGFFNRLAGLKVDALAAHQTLQSYIDIFTVALVEMEPQEIWETLTAIYNEQSLSSRKAEFMNVAKDFWHRVFYAPSVEPMLLRHPRHNQLKRRYCFIREEPDTSRDADDFIQRPGLPG